MKITLLWRQPLAMVLLCAALGISVFLALKTGWGTGLPGCGDAADCTSVLSSRFSQLAGLPAAWLGALVYGVLILTAGAWARRESSPVAAAAALAFGLAAGAAVWFTFLQIHTLRRICPWCMAVHGAGMLALVLTYGERRSVTAPPPSRASRFSAGVLPLSALTGIAALYLGTPKGGQPSEVTAAVSASATSPSGVIRASDASGTFALSMGGPSMTLDLRLFPVWGPGEAPFTAVLLTDYTCPHCREYEPRLVSLLTTLSPAYRLIQLPASRDGAGADIQKVMLTLFHADPALWHQLHDQLIGGTLLPDPSAVAAAALAALGDVRWSEAVQRYQNQVDQALQSGHQAQLASRARFPDTAVLPQLMAGGGVLMGAEPDAGVISRFLWERSLPAAPIADSPISAEPAESGLSLETSRLAVGEAAAGQTIRITLPIRNHGGQPVSLTYADLGPGCLIVRLSGEPILPGQEETVELECQAPEVSGPYQQTITLNTTGSALHATVEGTVTAKVPVPLAVQTRPQIHP